VPDAARRTLVLGGTRLLPADLPVRYVATGRTRPDDPEWTARIDAHRSRRPAGWLTVETSDLVGEFARSTDASLLVDDLATWLTGLLDDAAAWDGAPEALAVAGAEVDALVDAVGRCPGRLVLVSAEVGLGVVPATRSGRLFRDELGALNARLAQVSVARYSDHGEFSKGRFAISVLGRLGVITVIALGCAVFFQPVGLAVFAGLAIFQLLTIVSAMLPLVKEIRQS
jgi:adenosyl cobinamide kinase/adenosyl cobinamide phosphate guanylyltransferase